MAWYKYKQYLKESVGDAYDKVHDPGKAAPHAGIYRCEGCGHEIGIAEGHTLPPQNHAQHPRHDGPVKWRLVVYADHRRAQEQT